MRSAYHYNQKNYKYYTMSKFECQKNCVGAEVCRATLGDTAYLFWEQYVVKGAEAGMKFSWHQDSGYVGYPDHKPYLTCWCALDDMSEENGTVYVMPFSQNGKSAVGDPPPDITSRFD